MILLVGAAVTDGIAVVGDVRQLQVATNIAAGLSAGDVTVAQIDSLQRLMGSVQLLLFVPTAPVFVWWFHRAYSNLPTLGIAHPRFSKGWAISSWFLPVLNLIRPKQMADDIWRGSDPNVPQHEPPEPPPVAWWIHGWWAMWLAANVLYYAYANAPEDTVEQFVVSTQILIAADASAFVLDLFALVVVRAVTRRQDARLDVLPSTTWWLATPTTDETTV